MLMLRYKFLLYPRNLLRKSVLARFVVVLFVVMFICMLGLTYVECQRQKNNLIMGTEQRVDVFVELLTLVLREPVYNVDEDQIQAVVNSFLKEKMILKISVFGINKDDVLASRWSLSKSFIDLTEEKLRQLGIAKESQSRYFKKQSGENGGWEIIAEQGLLSLPEEARPYLTRQLQEHQQQYGVEVKERPILVDGERIGTVDIVFTLKSMQEGLYTLFLHMLFQNILIIGLVLIVTAVLLYQFIVSPIRELGDKLKDIAEGHGDLTALLVIKSEDEIGEVAQHVNGFIGKLRKMVLVIRGEVDNLASAATGLRKFSDEVNSISARQSTETQHVAMSVHEIVSTMHASTEKCEFAAQVAEDAQNVAEHTSEVMLSSIGAIEELSYEVEDASAAIDSQWKQSQNIESILDVIQEIAEETNMLALNAAIEAARAGEKGRGFAVVASEVRVLAQRTQNSAQEVGEMIHALQSSAQKATDVMKRGVGHARVSAEYATDARESLFVILDAIDMMNDQTQSIATSVYQQNTATQEIDANIRNINYLTQTTETGAQHITRTSVELDGLTKRLLTLMKQFKV
ncbi:Methyl-accepting chemotaxis protein 4 [Piscirickettsia salmonis]|uniref:Methyl-accepting chemotaxis protein 4 n=2 Tax=Piscirickettsia salmonis TaxID=1238 RepID=A0A9Q6LN59_PISSA|nr:Methyl-accepting chemotaxis protein 4 [Piscirickettsia salmonis]QGO06383.1 Methyl-accepting chemotaxis protein 4 [Piscirickettsia salmonis]QGO34709.1 Methyl-accepting chemotaxis protein 4 [Piscirickettsia salmonis]QGO38325.1 Methyl-accepting chemotaxis protein 4 [Piscirickettsia salmonis]QGO41942.1 Methyl-accepting chemotaxis protein 4 [Piscirickettsia salmonis]